MLGPPLTQAFFARPTLEVAQELLGCVLQAGDVRLRVVETEAYLPGDSANHSFRGKTARNAPMWGPPGHVYVYLCYGLHNMVNLVTEADGRPAAVLIRGATVLAGHDLVRARRGGRLDLIGPGKVGQGLGLTTSSSGRALGVELAIHRGAPPSQVRAGPRVGIDYASPEDRAAPWRFRGGWPEPARPPGTR
jgi:DNA-3-methyladenine glycosylase